MRAIIKEACNELSISRPEAELIVAALLERPRFEIYLNKDINNEMATVLKMRLKQLKKGIPIEYLTKRVQFLADTLKIYPGVFIPRLETEYFVELIKRLVNFTPENILEIGTGCGAIAIGLARTFPETQIIATDIAERAIKNAQENIATCKLSSQINLVRANLFEPIGAKFDLIVANPPYIPSARMKFLPQSVRDFEPRNAIDGGKDGIQFIKKLIEYGLEQLTSNGTMAIEIDEDEVKFLKDFLKTAAPYFSFKKDLFNSIRYLFIGSFKNEKGKPG